MKLKLNLELSKLTKSDVLYFFFFIILEFGEAAGKGASDKVFLTFAAAGFLFLIYKLVSTRYEYRELFVMAILGALAIFIYYNTQKEGGVLSLIALIGLKGVDTRRLLKLSFYIRLLTYLLLVFLASFDIIANSLITDVRGDNTVIRNSMGYSHPNQFHLAFIILLLLVIYLYYERLTALPIFLLGALNYLVYIRSYSRTSALIGFMAIVLMIWFRSNFFNKLKNAVCIGIIPASFLISIIPALMYDKIPHMWEIDRLLQWRFTFSRHYLNSYNLNLFGNNLNADPIVLDSGYVELIINYGLIFTFLFVTAYMVLIFRFIKKKMYRELLFIVCFSIYGLTESFIPNLFVNLSMIFFSEFIFNTDKKQNEGSVYYKT